MTDAVVASRFDPPVLPRTPTVVADGAAPPRDLEAEREEARRRGLEDARAQVEAAVAAHDAARRRLDDAATALAAAAAAVREHDAEAVRDLEREAVTLAVALAEAIIGHELISLPRSLRLALGRAAGLLPDRGELEVHVHPACLDDAAAAVEEVLGATADVRLVADPSVEAGGCVVAAGALRVDAQLSTAIERMRGLLSC